MVPCAFCTTWFHAFCAKRRLRGSTLDSLVSAWYHVSTASEPDDKPERLRVSRKENRHMSANFFKLPESDKRKIWAALLKEWAAKKAANRTTG